MSRSFSFPALISFIPFLRRVSGRAGPPRELSAPFFPGLPKIASNFRSSHARLSSRLREIRKSTRGRKRDGGENEPIMRRFAYTYANRVYTYTRMNLPLWHFLYSIKDKIREISRAIKHLIEHFLRVSSMSQA